MAIRHRAAGASDLDGDPRARRPLRASWASGPRGPTGSTTCSPATGSGSPARTAPASRGYCGRDADDGGVVHLDRHVRRPATRSATAPARRCSRRRCRPAACGSRSRRATRARCRCTRAPACVRSPRCSTCRGRHGGRRGGARAGRGHRGGRARCRRERPPPPELLAFLAGAGAYGLPGAGPGLRGRPAAPGPARSARRRRTPASCSPSRPPASAAHGSVRLALGGPHPGLAPLLAAGIRVTGADTYMATHPDALDLLTYLPEVDLG